MIYVINILEVQSESVHLVVKGGGEEDFQKVKCEPYFWRVEKCTDQQEMVGLLGNLKDAVEVGEHELVC